MNTGLDSMNLASDTPFLPNQPNTGGAANRDSDDQWKNIHVVRIKKNHLLLYSKTDLKALFQWVIMI